MFPCPPAVTLVQRESPENSTLCLSKPIFSMDGVRVSLKTPNFHLNPLSIDRRCKLVPNAKMTQDQSE